MYIVLPNMELLMMKHLWEVMKKLFLKADPLIRI